MYLRKESSYHSPFLALMIEQNISQIKISAKPFFPFKILDTQVFTILFGLNFQFYQLFFNSFIA